MSKSTVKKYVRQIGEQSFDITGLLTQSNEALEGILSGKNLQNKSNREELQILFPTFSEELEECSDSHLYRDA